jgi:hypothetical protein
MNYHPCRSKRSITKAITLAPTAAGHPAPAWRDQAQAGRRLLSPPDRRPWWRRLARIGTPSGNKANLKDAGAAIEDYGDAASLAVSNRDRFAIDSAKSQQIVEDMHGHATRDLCRYAWKNSSMFSKTVMVTITSRGLGQSTLRKNSTPPASTPETP